MQANLSSKISGALPKTKSTKNGLRKGTLVLNELYKLIRGIYPKPDKKPSDKTTERSSNYFENNIKTNISGVTTTQSFATWTSHEPDQKNQPKLDLYVFSPKK